jgi:hypothetical protein
LWRGGIMKLKWTWTYPTFFVGVSLSREYGFYAFGLGYFSLIYDRTREVFYGKGMIELLEAENGNRNS